MDSLSIVRIAAALVCSSIALRAQTIYATYDTVSPSLTFSGSFTGAGGFGNKIAGVLNFDYADAFCVEPGTTVASGLFLVEPTINLTNSDSIAKVMGAYLQSSKSNTEAAAAQWAIWEIVGDGIDNPSFRDGDIQIFFRSRPPQPLYAEETEIKALAYLALSQLPSTPSASIVYATNGDSQDVVFMIPEPSSALLGALGLTSLLIRRRR